MSKHLSDKDFRHFYGVDHSGNFPVVYKFNNSYNLWAWLADAPDSRESVKRRYLIQYLGISIQSPRVRFRDVSFNSNDRSFVYQRLFTF